MKFVVSKKGVKPLIFPWALYNSISVVAILFSIIDIDKQSNSKYVLIVFSILLIILNTTFFVFIMHCLSVVYFEKEVISCKFLGKIRRQIPYKCIKEYGIARVRNIPYIYITRLDLTDYQRTHKTFDLYRNTKGMIIFQYQERALEYLRTRLPSAEWKAS